MVRRRRRHQWYDRFIGGAVGAGLELNIVQGYEFLAKEYEEGDEVYVVGFSRGAYTARSLVGMIRNCGLISPKHLALRVAIASGIYRTRQDSVDSSTANMFRAAFSREIKIKYVGIWDTVGALGVPLNLTKDVNMKFYEFHDTKLSNIVENAFHAVAIDEHRQDYDVCLWSPESVPEQQLEQRWFLGAHCDVGGGYRDRRLSDMTLGWMQNKASALGLALNPVAVGQKNYLGDFTDAYAQFLGGLYAKKIRAITAQSPRPSSARKRSTPRCSFAVRKTATTSRRITGCRRCNDRACCTRVNLIRIRSCLVT